MRQWCSKFIRCNGGNCENIVEHWLANIPINVEEGQSDEDCDDHHAWSDTTSIISQPIGIRKNRPTYIGKLPNSKKIS